MRPNSAHVFTIAIARLAPFTVVSDPTSYSVGATPGSIARSGGELGAAREPR